jgi:hypothetical protein
MTYGMSLLLFRLGACHSHKALLCFLLTAVTAAVHAVDFFNYVSASTPSR